MPLLVPPSSPTGVLRYEWIDPGTTLRDLSFATSPNLFVSKGASGLGDVDVELSTDKIPFASGSLVRHANVPPRQIELPIFVQEDSLGDLVLVADAIRSWFATGDERRLTPGTLRITRPDDSVRQIKAYRTGGLMGDLNTGGPAWTQYVVSLLAPDPWPTGPDDTVHTYDSADFGVEQIVINQGELDAYPIWTVMGPVSAATPSIRIRRNSTDEEFGFNFALTAGIGVIVDTRPASVRTVKAVRRTDDLNLFSFLAPNPALWWLVPGENRFVIDIVGATGATSVELRYLARYRGLLR